MKSNFEIKDGEAILKINKNIYSKEIIVQATYVKLENYYFLIDEEDKYYIISIKYKNNELNIYQKLEFAIYEFLDELIEAQSYIDQLKRTTEIRQIILEKALLSQTIDSSILDMNLDSKSDKNN